MSSFFSWLRGRKHSYCGESNVKKFGARGDGSDDTTAIENAISALDKRGSIVCFPPGIYRCERTLRLGNNIQIVGAGREATQLQFTVTDDTPGIARDPNLSGQWRNLVLRDLSIWGTDGSGGCGIELVSAVGALFDNVWIDRFRSPSGVGCGVRILASEAGNCAWNRFDHVDIANCDTGLLMDSEKDTLHACGYMTFTALTIHQQRDCVVLKNTGANGSIYNRFFGLTMQGSRNPGGHFLVIEGHVNHVVSLVVDGGLDDTYHIWFRNPDPDKPDKKPPAGNRVSGGNYRIARVRDDNPKVVGGNTLDHSGTFAGGGLHGWWLNAKKVAPHLQP